MLAHLTNALTFSMVFTAFAHFANVYTLSSSPSVRTNEILRRTTTMRALDDAGDRINIVCYSKRTSFVLGAIRSHTNSRAIVPICVPLSTRQQTSDIAFNCLGVIIRALAFIVFHFFFFFLPFFIPLGATRRWRCGYFFFPISSPTHRSKRTTAKNVNNKTVTTNKRNDEVKTELAEVKEENAKNDRMESQPMRIYVCDRAHQPINRFVYVDARGVARFVLNTFYMQLTWLESKLIDMVARSLRQCPRFV